MSELYCSGAIFSRRATTFVTAKAQRAQTVGYRSRVDTGNKSGDASKEAESGPGSKAGQSAYG
ncbi:MAG TPA: hypothetical protein VFE47_01545, partial [Tepidisphaeraceae bacterium]|nr:hypothetical protein [Tepidisphaeraceae bacterium]